MSGSFWASKTAEHHVGALGCRGAHRNTATVIGRRETLRTAPETLRLRQCGDLQAAEQLYKRVAVAQNASEGSTDIYR